jgi:lactobin A/cerein 7B family class IIb bacteriocin
LTEEELKKVSGGILRTGLAVVHEGERIVAA